MRELKYALAPPFPSPRATVSATTKCFLVHQVAAVNPSVNVKALDSQIYVMAPFIA